MLKITHTILAGNCGDLNEGEIEAYGKAVNEAICKAYPGAEVETDIKWRTSGIGGGFDVRETDGTYEVEPDNREHDADAIEAHCASIAEKVFEMAGA